MKLKILRSKFIEGLKSVQNIVCSKGTMPILQNVMIEAKDGGITLTTTDLYLTMTCRMECNVFEEGITTMPVKLLFNSMSRASEGEVTVEVDDNDQATIKASSMRLRLNGKIANEFPRMESDDDVANFKMQGKTLFEMLRKTAYAASQDDTRRTLKGLLMRFADSKLTMVATDGKRLAMVENEIEIPANCECDVVVPSKTVQELQRMLTESGEVSIGIQKNKISFETGGIRMISKLIEDTYPNYNQVIPNNCSEKILIDRMLLLNAIERASVMTMDEVHSIKLTFSGNVLTVSSSVSEIGEAKDEVPIKYNGETIEITFNPNYVMDPLKAIDDDEISISMNNGHSPAVIRCSIPFLYVLMPLRIN